VGLVGSQVPGEYVLCLREILLEIVFDGRSRSEPSRPFIRAARSMERCDPPGDGVDRTRSQCARCEEHVGSSLIAQTHHVDRPIDDGSRATDSRSAVVATTNWNDAEINVWGQTPVQTHLGFASGFSLLLGTEVQKSKAHRLFQLDDILIEEKDPR